MEYRDLVRDMRRHCDGASFITISQLAAYMDQSHAQSVKHKYLRGLDAVEGKYFWIPDVAKAIYEKKIMWE